ncbi:AAA family ATPase [Streptomyces sp. NA02950]|uniref:helix-turn-helix transcriptional regulator n=1 Tax=Streptomyces sp. NA02950 TaxID=2742137 RepID=UPI001590C6E2|nr:helix-turn-helix transcriptional regulator [Streptomyces sp. NA02950]QKV98024.1 AAA family ATPase [Streptomyces sp. NA02950]
MVGRERESAAVLGLTSGVLIVTGEPGAGKSTLLALAADRHGGRVLRMTGSESEADLPFAGLHQLLRPVLGETARLPARQRSALLGAMGLGDGDPGDAGLGDVRPGAADPAGAVPRNAGPDGARRGDVGAGDASPADAGLAHPGLTRIDGRPAIPRPPGRLLLGVALLALLSDLARRSPLLVIVDDVQWIDTGSLETLAFVARRIDDEPLAVLAGARDLTGDGMPGGTAGGDAPGGTPVHGTRGGGSGAPAPFSGFPTLPLGPLDATAAGLLLDRQPHPPSGSRRSRILDQAAGNPLALVELARAYGACGTDTADEELLPPTDRLMRVFAADLDALPDTTRQALLLVAADDRAVAGRIEDLAPAEAAGLLRITGGGGNGPRARFRHPLIRSAIYHSVPLAARRQAHRHLAASLTAEPDRRAWHLAAAAEGPDEEIAAALEESAARARERGGYTAAATTLERAAELSPDGHDRARRLVGAAGAAASTGQPRWVRQLAARAGALTDDPALVAEASLRIGQVLTLTAEHTTALSSLLRAAEAPGLRRVAIATASVAGFYSGDEEHRLAVRAQAQDDPWTLTVTDPTEHRSERVAAIPALVERAGDDPSLLTSLGAMAWLLDETALAVRIFDDALHRWRLRGALPTGLGCSAGWAYLDHGLWAQARLAAANTASAGAGLPHLDAAVRSLDAAVLALTGQTSEARSGAGTALSLIDPDRSRAVAVRARWALGMAAVADGDQVSAYEQFRLLFTADGDPVHYACSLAGLAELAAAAVRTGNGTEATAVVARIAKRLAGDPSPRLQILLHRAQALLEPSRAEPHFDAALADPAGVQWPFERAQILLDHAEWLRRRHRITEARARLSTALESFRRLGARPWIDRTQAELRAAGVDSAPAAPDALNSLTPQQQHIIRLAAQGLSNREIGERLFLSPRTVGSHLYRSFPKLGVTARSQLRDLLKASSGRVTDRV